MGNDGKGECIMKHLMQPILHTERLLLRPIKLTDKDDLFEYAVDPRVGPNAGWKPHESIADTIKFIEYSIKKRDFGQPGVYAIVLPNTNKMIGTIEIHSLHGHKAEIGYVLNPEYWGNGYVPEAAKAVIVYAFEILKLKRLQNGYFSFNERSKRVSEKLEFVFEGILRKKYMSYTGEPLDEAILSLTDEDYHSNKISWLKGFTVDYKEK